MLKRWEELPDFMRVPEVRPYYDILAKKQVHLMVKRLFDIVMAVVILVILALPMIMIAIAIKLDSKGAVLYRQERITTYGRSFKIHKFRTMVDNAYRIGSAITANDDNRVTRIGKILRRMRMDEFPQVFDVLSGNMSFVGTRPEVPKYVKQYTPEMRATLLVPAGITSEASVRYREESKLLSLSADIDQIYLEQILPAKMFWNLKSIRDFRLAQDAHTLARTILAVLGKNYDNAVKKDTSIKEKVRIDEGWTPDSFNDQ